jgi:putative methyltransferase (TIGR04325 family)
MTKKALLKELIPPLVLKKITGLFYGWKGNYPSWSAATEKASGYDSEIILNRVKSALLKVKSGEAVYERDSVIFDKVHYSFPLLSALSQIALKNNRKLNVLDFGGSLGSSYYQNKAFFADLEQFNWCIVEQKHFVEEGKKTFADKNLHFFYDIDSCTQQHTIDVLLLSSVLQYLEKPYEFIDSILAKNIPYIIIDRAPMLAEGDDRITLQTVPKAIYEAKYPCWILNEKKVLNALLKQYDLVFEQQTEETINISGAAFKAFFLKKK